jgi:hypothetical protein
MKAWPVDAPYRFGGQPLKVFIRHMSHPAGVSSGRSLKLITVALPNGDTFTGWELHGPTWQLLQVNEAAEPSMWLETSDPVTLYPLPPELRA